MSRPKYQETPEQDFTSRITKIVEKTACGRHKAPIGTPCYHLAKDGFGHYSGICNFRIEKVYNGKPAGKTPTQSFHSNRRPKKENRG